NSVQHLEKLYKAIGTLRQLKHLDLLYNNLTHLGRNLAKLKPVLRNLDHLSLHFNMAPISELRLISLCTRATSMKFYFGNGNKLSPECFQRHLAPHVLSQVTSLSIDEVLLSTAFKSDVHFDFICERFINL